MARNEVTLLMGLCLIYMRNKPLLRRLFLSEFVAMTHGVETLCGIRYKLRIMGILIDGPTYVYGDNMSVVFNTSLPESQLKKKSNSVCYHAVRESVAIGECITTHIITLLNFSDLLTNIFYGQK